jgi:hypothetical protein
MFNIENVMMDYDNAFGIHIFVNFNIFFIIRGDYHVNHRWGNDFCHDLWLLYIDYVLVMVI